MLFMRPIAIVLIFFLGLFVLRGPIQDVDENLIIIKEHYIDPVIAYVTGNKDEPKTLGDSNSIPEGSIATTTDTVKTPITIPDAKAGSKPVLISKDTGISADSSSLSISGILAQTNKNRAMKNLKSLRLNSNLNSAAQRKLEDMFSNQYFEHVSPKGVDVTDLVRKAGYEYIVVGENLALGNFGGDVQVVTAWMNSPGHRANILDTRFQEIGIAVGKGLYNGKQQWIAVQHFAKPLSSCEGPNAELKIRIDTHTAELAVRESELNTQKKQIDSSNSGTPGYGELVEKYNISVVEYNTRLEGLKDEISTYNAQVRTFNSCAGLGN